MKNIKNSPFYKAATGILIILVALLFFGKNGESKGKDDISVTEQKGSVFASEITETEDADNSSIEKETTIVCDISGEVNLPGVYTISGESRLYELIAEAGGMTENADIDAINQARHLVDGEKIYIPAIGEKSSNDYRIESIGSEQFGGRININIASSEELQTINGIGPSTAQKIIDYRNEYGEFTEIEELKNISGIGDKTFNKLKDYVTV